MNEFFESFIEPWLLFFARDPLLLSVQLGLVLLVAVLIFLIFFTTRDILLRTHSFWYTLVSVVLVAVLPVVGFLIYLLIRPSQTLKQREMYVWLRKLSGNDTKKSKEPKEKKDSNESKDSKEEKKK